MTVISYQRHIEKIAVENRVAVIPLTPFTLLRAVATRPNAPIWMWAFAYPSRRTIEAEPVRGDISYIGLLHEFGHILRGHDERACQYQDYRMMAEIDAWDWAFANALQVTPVMYKMRRAALNTYHQSYFGVPIHNF